ncbi:MAG: hypothetical protein ACRCY7_08780 [Cetobacterium sp.]|uniref:hypothetical protein n=1 Tax=Cetobacterium sp. TaxID=2071632 RepID=UPI003F3B1BC9
MNKKRLKELTFLLAAFIVISNVSVSENSSEETVISSIGTIDMNLLERESKKQKKVIYPGRFALEDRGAYIYSLVDPVPIEPKLSLGTKPRVALENTTIPFYVYTNYPKNISKYEIFIYSGEDEKLMAPVDILCGENLNINEMITWDFKNKITPEDGDEYFYKLRVYDKYGNFDETNIERFHFEDGYSDITKEYNFYGKDNTKSRSILVSGSRVRVYGKGLNSIRTIDLNGQPLEVDKNGDFVYEMYTENEGEKILNVKLYDNHGKEYNYDMKVDIPRRYDFLVGMADIFIGENYISGDDSILSPNNEYKGDIFTTGRLAFYYKGLWESGYRVTAQADTWANDFEYMFKDFSKRTPREMFEKLERDDIEFNLGDDSTYYRDTDTAGKFYLKVEKNKSNIMWGSYNTGFTGNYFADYDRSLYGARAEYQSLQGTEFGESRYQAKGFISEPETLFTSDEFQGTGGSVYFLSFQDIVTGSAKIRVEVRDPRTGRVLRDMVLNEGADYEINELQGRVILKNPLPTIVANSASADIIKEMPYYGESVVLVADYEFYSSDTDFGKLTYGTRAKAWLTDNIALGGTLVNEARGDGFEDYELEGADLTLRKTDNTYLRMEVAHSKGSQNIINNFSYNGGYNIDLTKEDWENILSQKDLNSMYNNIDGYAYYLEGELALKDVSEEFGDRDRMGFWYRKKERGFSRAGLSNNAEIDDYGVELDYEINDKWELSLGANKFKEIEKDFVSGGNNTTEEDRADLMLSYKYSSKLTLSTEMEYIKNREWDTENNYDEEEAVLVGVRADYEFLPNKTVYAKAQTDVLSENYEANNLYTLGTDMRIGEKLRLNAEGSTGNRGQGVQAILGYDVTPDYNVYAGYALDNEGSLFNDGNNSIFTVGQKFRYNDNLNMFQENQYVDQSSGRGFLQTYGLDYEYSTDLSLGALIQQGDLDTNSGELERTSVSLYSKYYGKDFMVRNKLEYGRDRGNNISADTWATINRAKKVINEEYTLFGKLNYIYRDSFYDKDDKSAEAGIGLAYRPIWNDRLNLIGKYKYVYNMGIDSQLNSTNDEKAHILSLEGIYEFNQRWDIGAKYAVRFESLRAGQGEGEWYDSNLDLYAVRLNYEFIKKWYAFGEYHLLRDMKDDSYEHGAIVGLYREVGENFKVGVGYNFTQFDDDLTDLDYNAKGWFINLIGKF